MRIRIKTEEEFLNTDKVYRMGNGGFGIDDDSYSTEFPFGPGDFPSMEKYLGKTINVEEKNGEIFFIDEGNKIIVEPWIVAKFIK